MELNIATKTRRKKEIKIEAYGPYESIEDIFPQIAAEAGHQTLDLLTATPAELEAFQQKPDGRKKINPDKLFGSSKPYGALPVYKRQPFSHTRIFGHRKAPPLPSFTVEAEVQ